MSWPKGKEQDPEESIPTREINAKFKSRIPIILEDVAQCMIVIEPAIRDITIPLREFLDFLEFEISKTSLQIEKDTWQSVVDVDKTNADKAWLAHLEQLRDDFDIEKMTSTATFLNSIFRRVQDTFNMRVAYM